MPHLPTGAEMSAPACRRTDKMAKPKASQSVAGRWLIDTMTMWDRDFIDAEVRGYFEFGDGRFGRFQFGYVQGQVDYRVSERASKPLVEFSWNGADEMDPARGRGWLVLEGEALKGMFYIHAGDESGIVLRRKAETQKEGKR